MLRITAGEFRGREIETPPPPKPSRKNAGQGTTRPTQAKLRQALFNSLQFDLPGAHILELFAGSGALGFEGLSRGAASVIFCENAKLAQKMILKNAASLGVRDRIRVLDSAVGEKSLIQEVDLIVTKAGAPFDLIVADPPYSKEWETKILNEIPWNRWLKPGGKFCLEWGREQMKDFTLPEREGQLVKVREKLYGDSVLTTYRMEENSVENS